MFTDLFAVKPTGNRIDLLTHSGRAQITQGTVRWWESQGWEVVLWDNTGNLPAVGRNRIIEDYKHSDRNLLIMADDDITLYTHRFLTQSWLENPIQNGVYTVNSNHKMHLLAQNSSSWGNTHQWSMSHHISQMYVIDRKDVPLQDETLVALEDTEWAWQCLAQGIMTQMLHTVFLREQSQDVGSVFCTDRRQRLEIYQRAKEQIADKWGTHKWSEFKKRLTNPA